MVLCRGRLLNASNSKYGINENRYFNYSWSSCSFLLKRLYDIFIVPFRRKKLLQKAFKKNRCVKAYLVDYHDNRFGDTDHHTVRIHAFYHYTVDGRTYSYRRWYNNSPEYEITLYYQHNPRKAFEADHFGRLEGFGKMVLLYVISVAVILIINQ